MPLKIVKVRDTILRKKWASDGAMEPSQCVKYARVLRYETGFTSTSPLKLVRGLSRVMHFNIPNIPSELKTPFPSSDFNCERSSGPSKNKYGF
jgi:hypothetical protein